ncbi:MAG TPA: homoserine kinase [Bacteroidales bacterium]|nr:homoserine kinase [Bacteroidales bacterium]
MNRIKAFAPATVSNLNCGFDVLGFALNEPGDVVEIELDHSGKVQLMGITGDGGLLPVDPQRNTATAVVRMFLDRLQLSYGARVWLHKGMPLNSGLGSSAASSVAALVAINHLTGYPMEKKDLLRLAMEGERLACGSAHADNVAPCLYGGLVLIRSYDPLEVIQLPIPESLTCMAVHPHVHIPTREAREAMPKDIPLKTAIAQWANLAGFVSACYSNDHGLLSRSMTDLVAEPVRAPRIPFFDAMRTEALNHGALAFGISGSGPTVFGFFDKELQAQHCGKAIADILKNEGIDNEWIVSPINEQGARIIPTE